MIETQTVYILAGLFLFVALLYSSVGLGGGSTYTALLTIAGVSYLVIPTISLSLNLVVTFIGMINFYRGGHVKPKLIFPFLITSMPFAYLGGALHLSREVFLWLLMITLIMVVVRIYVIGNLTLRYELKGTPRLLFSLALGAVLGFVAGTVGIGGGIYLVPLMIMFGLSTEKEAAATGAVFIWLNSFSGLAARFQRDLLDPETIIPLIIGGYIGSNLGSQRFSPRVIQRTLGLAIVVAIFFISRKLIF